MSDEQPHLSTPQFKSFSGATQGLRYDKRVGVMGHPDDSWDHRDQVLDLGHLDRRSPQTVEYGKNTAGRPSDPTKWNGQMALPGMPKPTDPHLHRLRQANPNLNDYQFSEKGGKPGGSYSVKATSKETGKRAGYMDLGYRREDYPWDKEHVGHREVQEIGVAPHHQGKGLAEAMYDLSRMRGQDPVHSTERSESGESFAKRVGGPALERRKGHGDDHYLGLPYPGGIDQDKV